MAEFIRGGSGVVLPTPLPRYKMQGSPSTGSDEGPDPPQAEDFDPFLAETEEPDPPSNSDTSAPPESQ